MPEQWTKPRIWRSERRTKKPEYDSGLTDEENTIGWGKRGELAPRAEPESAKSAESAKQIFREVNN